MYYTSNSETLTRLHSSPANHSGSVAKPAKRSTFITLGNLCPTLSNSFYCEWLPPANYQSKRRKNKFALITFLPMFFMLTVVFLLLATAGSSTAYAQPVDHGCAQRLQDTQAQLQRAQSEFSTCRSVKLNQLENFNAKRARYLRLIAWAGNLEFADALKPYINALNERDSLLTSKAEEFELCVPPLRNLAGFANPPEDGGSCDKAVTDIHSEIAKMAQDLKTCQACSLGIIGGGYNKSAVETLIVQQHDARVLRHALYQQFISEEAGSLSIFNPWLITRDVFLAYITDTAVQMPSTQKLIVMLEHLEQTLEPIDKPGEYTDRTMAVYRQLADTLQSGDKNQAQQAERLWQMFTDVVAESKAAAPAPRTIGFNDVTEMAQRFHAIPPQDREMLVSVINTALKKYESYKRLS